MFNLPSLIVDDKPLHLTVRSRTDVLFQGSVKAVTSLNNRGRFDILPEHTNFISVIKDYLIIHGLDKKDQELKITQGVMKVKNNEITIYLGIVPETKKV